MSDDKHVYDDIEELDNPIPKWFTGIFVGTILFATGYYVYYTFMGGPTLLQEYEREQAQMKAAALQVAGNQQSIGEPQLLALVSNPEARKKGAGVYLSKCAACHGAKGEGGIGPNLTDDFWIHGGKLTAVVKTIANGISDKGMPPWGPVISTEEIQAVAAHIRGLRGTNPSNGKAPQGEKEIF